MIAIDWGTSSLRAYRVDSKGVCSEKREAPLGILRVPDGNFAAALQSVIGDWLAGEPEKIVMSGMIGSRQGWKEAPYVECPGSEPDILRNMVEVSWGANRASIVPGFTCRDAAGVADVMRGEETQVLGALSALGDGEHLICLPGTHSKWVLVRNRRVVSFSTHMTGEVYALLTQHSILGKLMSAAPAPADALSSYFDKGLARARDEGGLLNHLFGVRAEGLFGRLPAEEAADYLSGLLIGHEVLSVRSSTRYSIALVGAAPLTARYARALSAYGQRSRALDEDFAMAGLFRLSIGAPRGRR